jgi:hypothetical protein
MHSLIFAVAGCEAGNELADRDSAVLALTDEDAEKAFHRLSEVCRQHVSAQAKMINESDGALIWTSPYYWHVVWIRLPKGIAISDEQARAGTGDLVAWVDQIIGEDVGRHVVRKASGVVNEDGAFADDVEIEDIWGNIAGW